MTTEAAVAKPRNGLATTSLILGIVTIVPGLLLSILGSLIGMAAFVVGIIALVQISRDKSGGQGTAIAGIVLGVIGAALAPFATIVVLMIFGPVIGNTFSTINSSLMTPGP